MGKQGMARQPSATPSAARWLGLAGLIPFAAAAGAGMVPVAPLHDLALQALLAYGAVILSFLGGIRWGLATAMVEDPAALSGPLCASVLPALLGWFALLVPASAGLIVLALGFAAMLLADLRLTMAPPWYRSLRLPLSAGAITALLVGLVT